MGGFLDNLKKFFALSMGDSASGFINFKVKCKRCGEEIEVNVRRSSDISRLYESEGPENAEFFLRKEILGKKCNNLIYIKVYFAPDLNVISKDISGGEFVE